MGIEEPLLPIDVLKRIEKQTYPIVVQGVRIVVVPPRHVFQRQALELRCEELKYLAPSEPLGVKIENG